MSPDARTPGRVPTRAHPAHTGLCACTLGLLLSPLGYVAIGAYGEFSPLVAWLTAPMLLLGMGGLVRLLLVRAPATASVWPTSVEVLCWLCILGVQVVISDIRLMGAVERCAASALFFLGMSVLSWPLAAWRPDTRLARRWARLPQRQATALLVLWVTSAAAVALAGLLPPPPMPI